VILAKGEMKVRLFTIPSLYEYKSDNPEDTLTDVKANPVVVQ
jgi:hypothetical protein